MTMSEEDRINLMKAVRDHEITVDDAVRKLYRYYKQWWIVCPGRGGEEGPSVMIDSNLNVTLKTLLLTTSTISLRVSSTRHVMLPLHCVTRDQS